MPEIAERNLEITASGVLRASLDPGVDHRAFEEAFATVAQTSLEAYRALVHDPEFVEYYEESTPLAEIALLNIGSRPARRSDKAKRTLDDLRAIPWVFAWTQSRQMVPGWFGAGRALCRLIDERGLAFARRMNAEWPFFASTLDAVAVSLATADMDIARRYAGLVDDGKAARRLFFKIALDHGRAERAVMLILDRLGKIYPNGVDACAVDRAAQSLRRSAQLHPARPPAAQTCAPCGGPRGAARARSCAAAHHQRDRGRPPEYRLIVGNFGPRRTAAHGLGSDAGMSYGNR